MCLCVCVCVYGLKKKNKMTICVSATHFPDYIQSEVATLLSFVLLVYIPYNTNAHIHVMYIYTYNMYSSVHIPE